MKLLVDTGSSWTWIPTSDCPNDQCTRGHYKYGESTDFKNTTYEDDEEYGRGAINGHIVNDRISLSNNGKGINMNFLAVYKAHDFHYL